MLRQTARSCLQRHCQPTDARPEWTECRCPGWPWSSSLTAAGAIGTIVPRPFLALDVDRAAAQLDVAAGDRQAEAGAGGLGREVGLEDARERLLVHADAGVRDPRSTTRVVLDGRASAPGGPSPGIACSAFSTMLASARAISVRSTSTGGSGGGDVDLRCSMRPASPTRYGSTTSRDELGHDRPARGARSATTRSSRTPRRSAAAAATWPRIVSTQLSSTGAERLAAIGVHAAQVLGRELDRRQRVLDLVRDLPRHLGPGLEPVRALELIALRLQLGRHAVERVDQAAQLVGRCARRCARRNRRARSAASRASAGDRIGDALGHRQ